MNEREIIADLVSVIEEITVGYRPHSGGSMCTACWAALDKEPGSVLVHEPDCIVKVALTRAKAWLDENKMESK